jgi:hypothetical protein
MRMKFNVCEKSDGVMKGTRNDQCPICGAAELGTYIILRFTKTPATNWRCVREMEIPHTNSFE